MEDAEDGGDEELASDLEEDPQSGEAPAGPHQRRARPLEDRGRSRWSSTSRTFEVRPMVDGVSMSTIRSLVEEERATAFEGRTAPPTSGRMHADLHQGASDPLQPAEQRGQIHPERPGGWASTCSGAPSSRGIDLAGVRRVRLGHRHPAGEATERAHLRRVLSGRRVHHPRTTAAPAWAWPSAAASAR